MAACDGVEHVDESGAESVERFDVQVDAAAAVKEDGQFRVEVLFPGLVAEENRAVGQGVQDQGDIGRKQCRTGSLKKIHQIQQQVRVRVGQPPQGLGQRKVQRGQVAQQRRVGVVQARRQSLGIEHRAGDDLVEDLLARGVAEVDDGAVVVRVEGFEQPCLVRKSDGGFLYATTDIAAIRRRVQEMGADEVVYCVDARQSLHFDLVFGAARKAGYATRPGHDHPSRLRHAAFGMVLGEDHRPFRTRSGENVRLRALLDEALARARGVVRAKNPGIDEASCEEIARGVAVAAMRHADLSNDRVKDYVFSFERMLAFEGNTGPYLQYALVRVRKILAEAEQRGMSTGGAIHIEDASERALALTLLRYPGTLVGACEALEPHRVVGYLYDLATVFSTFYDRCHVLRAEDERVRSSRLRLCRVFERVLADGLGVLGIPALARM